MNEVLKNEMHITDDIVFQRFFGKVGNEHITKNFLSKVLGIEIEELTLDTNKRLIGDLAQDKVGRIDVKAVLNDGTKVIIEMQVAKYKYMAKRLLYYWSKTYAGDLKRGSMYDKLDKTIAILISVEDLNETKGIEKYHTKWEIREEEYTDKVLTEDLEIHIIELGKFKEGEEPRPEDNWIRFLKARGKEEMEELSRHDREMKEAMDELEYLTSTEELQEIYEQRIIDLRDKLSYGAAEREDGYDEGMEKGKKAKQKEIVLNMNKKKMRIEDICEIVSLSKEEVEKIIQEENEN